MKIKENDFEGSEFYTAEIRERVEAVFQDALEIYEIKSLTAKIKKESAELRNLFWTEEELKQKQEAVGFFDARMQSMVYYTLKNIEGYQQSGWKELIYEGEDSDETTESI
jgi:hypothetical protein